MFKLIKWLFFIAIIAGVALWYTGYKVRGKTIQEYAKPYLETKIVKEGIRDARAIVGEGLKAAGEAISEDVTDSERKQLDNLVRDEMQKGKPIEGAAGQQALPPTAQPAAQAQKSAAVQPAAVQPAAPQAPAPKAPFAPKTPAVPSVNEQPLR